MGLQATNDSARAFVSAESVGAELPVFVFDAHMPRRRVPHVLLNGLYNAFPDATALRLFFEVQILPGNLYRHCLRKTW